MKYHHFFSLVFALVESIIREYHWRVSLEILRCELRAWCWDQDSLLGS